MPVTHRRALPAALAALAFLLVFVFVLRAESRAAGSGRGASQESDDLILSAEAAGPQPVGGELPPSVTARGVVVIDGESGALLLNKNAHQQMAPASLTKIMTAYIALQRLDPRKRVIVTLQPGELDPDSTIMGLDFGEELSVEDLLYGLMLPSGNDAAVVLARTVAGSDGKFVDLMNETARSLDLRNTHFANSHGLDDPKNLTTAYDIAQLARIAMRDERFRRIVATDSWTVKSQWTYVVRNKNAFLHAYPGADGVKIGWTDAAGATIVASATRNGHRVFVALLNTDDRVGESSALLDWAFANFRWPGDPPPITVGRQ